MDKNRINELLGKLSLADTRERELVAAALRDARAQLQNLARHTEGLPEAADSMAQQEHVYDLLARLLVAVDE